VVIAAAGEQGAREKRGLFARAAIRAPRTPGRAPLADRQAGLSGRRSPLLGRESALPGQPHRPHPPGGYAGLPGQAGRPHPPVGRLNTRAGQEDIGLTYPVAPS
jgi:hypothetical protein